MNRIILCFLLLIGAMCTINAQDKLVLRDGRSINVNHVRVLEDRVEYTYPGETLVYYRLKTAISYILYENGKTDIIDRTVRESDINARTSTTPQRATSTQRQSPANNALSTDENIFWEDVKTTYMESEVNGMTRLKRVSAISNISYKDAIQQLKKKAADIGGTTILVMDSPDEDEIEVMGIAYRDRNYVTTPSNTQRNVQTAQSPEVRRRRIAQQMESYNDESDLQYNDNTTRSNRNTVPQQRDNRQATRQQPQQQDDPDAVYLTNGRVVKGVIEEIDDDYVSIRIPTGRVNEYSMDDVRRVSRGTTGNTQRRASSTTTTRDRRADNRSSSSVVGYKGTFDAGYNIAMGGTGEKGNLELNTSHGYQLNEYLFVGAGVGLHMYSARDAQLKTNMSSTDKFPQYVAKSGTTINDSVTYMRAVDSSYMTLPLFLDIRGYMPLQNSAITPFAMFRLGYAFNLSDGFGGMGLYMNPAVGVKYQITPMIGINFSVGYAYQNYGGVPKPKDGSKGGYGYYYIKDATKTKYEAKGAGGISIKLGIEF